MATNPDVPPEAALIKERRMDRIPKMGVPAAAAAATKAGVKMSAEGWRAIESGRYDGPEDKLAIMAHVVGIGAAELRELGEREGRPNVVRAAELLESLLRQRAAAEPAVAGSLDVRAVPEEVLRMILKGLDDIRAAEGLTESQKSMLERSLMEAVVASVGGQIVQIRTALDILARR